MEISTKDLGITIDVAEKTEVESDLLKGVQLMQDLLQIRLTVMWNFKIEKEIFSHLKQSKLKTIKKENKKIKWMLGHSKMEDFMVWEVSTLTMVTLLEDTSKMVGRVVKVF